MKIFIAEFIGTFWLILGGCGSAVLSATFPETGIGILGVSLAFGLSLITMAYTFGTISGGHFNPAVTIGAWITGKVKPHTLLLYIAGQLNGALTGAAILYILVSEKDGSIGNFAANGYGEYSPGNFSMYPAFLTEFLMTFMFVLIILIVTKSEALKKVSGIVIGLALTLIHLISIPVTNTSVNPARSFSQAVFVGDWALDQLWLFIIAPIAGSVIAGICYRYLINKHLEDDQYSQSV